MRFQKPGRPSLSQNDVGNRFSDLTIVAPVTSKYDAELYPTEALAVSVGLANV